MSVTILCPKCRAERTDATPKAFNHANHDWLLAVATKNWNKRPIAPPVAAGSVDTCAEMRALCSACGGTGDVHSIDGEWRGQCTCVHAWQQRAEKAEAEMAATKQALVYEQRHAAESEVALAAEHTALLKAEARTKELELDLLLKNPLIEELRSDIREFKERVKGLEAEDLAMHRKLAAETLRSDQGWARYEAANTKANQLMADRAVASVQPVGVLGYAIFRHGQQQAVEMSKTMADRWVDAQCIPLVAAQERATSTCDCHACQPITLANNRMILCPKCGNKRCPHAGDHRNACTGSNEPGQAGSAYA